MATTSGCVSISEQNNNCDTVINSVDNILKVNFSLLDLNSKVKISVKIKSLGRPTPDLKLNQTCTKEKKGRSFTRHFTRSVYDRNKFIHFL